MFTTSFVLLLLAQAPAPHVTIAAPTTSTTVSGHVRVTGDLAHHQPIVKMELHADGKPVTTSTSAENFSLVWDATKATRGKHTLTVKAYDAAGRVGQAEVQVQVRQTFSVKDHGAKGDGKADGTRAIRAALDAARKAGGGTVHLPKGTYLVTPRAGSCFAVGSNLELRGDGPSSILKVADGASDYNLLFGQLNAEIDLPFVENIAFRDFRVDQNPTGNRAADIREDRGIQNVVQLHHFKNVTLQGVHFDAMPGIQAIVLDSPKPGSGGAVIDSCFFRFVRGRSTLAHKYDHSSVYTETRNVLVRNNVFQAEFRESAITAIEVHGGPDVQVRGNRIDGFQIGIIVVNATPPNPEVADGRFVVRRNQILQTTQGIALWSLRGRTLRGVVVQDNEITMARHELYADVWLGIYLYHNDKDNATDGDFEQIEIARNKISFEKLKAGSTHAVGIELAPAGQVKNIVVKENTIRASPARGIHVGNPTTRRPLQDIRIEANTVVDAGWDRAVPEASRAAILLDKAMMTNLQVRDNVLRDTGKPGAPRGRFAIRAHPAPGSKAVAVGRNKMFPEGALRNDLGAAVTVTR